MITGCFIPVYFLYMKCDVRCQFSLLCCRMREHIVACLSRQPWRLQCNTCSLAGCEPAVSANPCGCVWSSPEDLCCQTSSVARAPCWHSQPRPDTVIRGGECICGSQIKLQQTRGQRSVVPWPDKSQQQKSIKILQTPYRMQTLPSVKPRNVCDYLFPTLTPHSGLGNSEG